MQLVIRMLNPMQTEAEPISREREEPQIRKKNIIVIRFEENLMFY